jgi:uncharacterized protein (DUF433 family)
VSKRPSLLDILRKHRDESGETQRPSAQVKKLPPESQSPKAVKSSKSPVQKSSKEKSSRPTGSMNYVKFLRAGSPSEVKLSESEKRNARILSLRSTGITLDDIGSEFGLTRERVRQIVVKCGGPEFEEYCRELQQSELASLEQEHELIRDYVRVRPGITKAEIADHFQIPLEQVLGHLSKFELKLVLGSRPAFDASRFWNDEKILDALRLAQTYHYPLKTSHYQALVDSGEIKGPSVALIASRFKTWKQACIAAGVEYVESYTSYSVTWTREELVAILGDYLVDPGTTGTGSDYNRWRDAASDRVPSLAQLRLVLGHWSQACDEALSNIRSNSWDRSNGI